MKEKKFRLSFIALLLCLCTTLSSYAYLKIDTSDHPVTNTFIYSSNGSLFDTDDPDKAFTLLEHAAEKQSDGNYKLDTSTTTTANTYDVLPGMTVPKDPYITITGKNSVPAYLYVEIEDGIKDNEHFSYSVNSAFEKITVNGTTHTGDLYVYKTSNSYLINDETNLNHIDILQNNQVIVDEKDDLEVDEDSTLTFKAYMTQASIDSNPAEAFKTAFE